MSLIRNLDVHQAPTFAPYERLEVLSTNVIRNRVIRAVKTSLYSVKPESARIRTIATFTLPQRALPDGLKFFSRMKPEVVAGGKYVIVENQGQIELWSIQDSERIWTSPGPGEPLYCHSFGSEIQQDGNILTIAAAYVDYLSGKRYIVHILAAEPPDNPSFQRRPCPPDLSSIARKQGGLAKGRSVAFLSAYNSSGRCYYDSSSD